MSKVRIGINGFGRIGRGFVRCLADSPGGRDAFDLVLINDLTDHRKGVDRDNYYRTMYGPQPLEHGLLSERQMFKWIAATGAIALAAGAYLAVVRTGGELRWEVDGREVLSYEDEAPLRGEGHDLRVILARLLVMALGDDLAVRPYHHRSHGRVRRRTRVAGLVEGRQHHPLVDFALGVAHDTTAPCRRPPAFTAFGRGAPCATAPWVGLRRSRRPGGWWLGWVSKT